MEQITIDTLCLSGGGVKGFAFLGSLEYLEDIKYIDIKKINNYVGTSAGAMLAFIFSLGYSVMDVVDFIINFNFTKLIPDTDINTVLLSYGIDTGDKIMIIMQNFLKEKYNLDDITFEEHYLLTNMKLTFIGTNYNKGTEIAFNHINSPKMSVLTALRISISVPIIFTPVLYESEYYIDGGLVNNFPIKYCNPSTTIGIYIKHSISNKMDNILNLTMGCLSIVTDIISRKDCNDCDFNNYNVIEIENFNQETTNFDIDMDKKIKIINIGKKSAKKFIENQRKPKKIEKTVVLTKADMATQTDEILVEPKPTH
jgi:predicted patatin/cPLA2 family phospholipase